jgi:hypothetical protein
MGKGVIMCDFFEGMVSMECYKDYYDSLLNTGEKKNPELAKGVVTSDFLEGLDNIDFSKETNIEVLLEGTEVLIVTNGQHITISIDDVPDLQESLKRIERIYKFMGPKDFLESLV